MDNDEPSDKAINLHNEMVHDLSTQINQKELENLKYLLRNTQLTDVDIEEIDTVQRLFVFLQNKNYIGVGRYTDLLPKLDKIKPRLSSVVIKYTKAIGQINQQTNNEEMVVSMDKAKYHVKEELTAYLNCTVKPTPASIIWRKGHEHPQPSTIIPIDNRKYYSGCPDAPTLVIKEATKAVDEAHYQCSATAKSTTKDGLIVHLEVLDEPSKSAEHARNQQGNGTEDPDDDNVRPSSSRSSSSPRRMQHRSEPPQEMHIQNTGAKDFGITIDMGSQASVVIKNKIDPKRSDLVKVISSGFSTATSENGRVAEITFKTHCILVCIDITPARSLVEPSSVHLAEQFRHFILDGGRIRLSDESGTILDFDETSFQITPHNTCHDDRPYVNISHGNFTVPVGGSAILQTYLIAPKIATLIRWFKIKRNQQVAIEIDNEKYFGGSDLSPTLIIRNAKIDDEGQYLCWATNKFGTCSSNTASVLTKVKRPAEDSIFKTVSIQDFNPKHTISESSSSGITDANMPIQPKPCDGDTCDSADKNMPIQPKPSDGDTCDSEDKNMPIQPKLSDEDTCDSADKNMPIQPKPSDGDTCDSADKNMPIQPKPSDEDTCDSADSNRYRREMIKIYPEFANMIESTKLMLNDQENEEHWVDTRGYVEAKNRLLKNTLHVVIIKGNSGDGKTSIACQLLRELCSTKMDVKHQRGRQPLELHYIKDLDKVANKSQVAIFFDDLFGKDVVSKEDMKELKKLERHLLAKLRGDEKEVNFLIITIQSLIFNSVQNHMTGKLFSESNIIDLTSKNYFDHDDKRKLLRKYQPKDTEFKPWKDDEVDKIVKLSPDIGFPQCCRLFRDSPPLRERRVDFFKTPFQFLKSLMMQMTRGHFYGLVYLFLKGGEVTETDLDPQNENREQVLLDAAFANDVVDTELTAEVLYKKGTKEYVQKSLKHMEGFLVKNVEVEKGKQEIHQKFTTTSAFKFNHDSIERTVAILYGEKTHIGFIKYCPRKCLTYITTNRHTEHSIVLAEEEHPALHSRLLSEFKDIQSEHQENVHSDKWKLYHCITSMDVWANIDFVKGFLGWLDDEKCDATLSKRIRVTLLNASCSYGSNDCALYILQKGATFDEHTFHFVIERDCVDVLKKIERSLSKDTKTDLMNKACSMGSEECASHLLSKCPVSNDTPFCIVEGGSSKLLDQILPYLKAETRTEKTRSPNFNVREKTRSSNFYVRDINVLHEACLFQREEMVEKLCDNIPNLISGKTSWDESVFHLVSKTGNCNLFCTLEKKMFNYLGFAEEHKVCHSVGSDAEHEQCEHEQYMCELKDIDGLTVLHQSCISGVMDLVTYLCKFYPALTDVRSADGCHCLHYIAYCTSDVALFQEMEACVKQNMESKGQTYDITKIKDNDGHTILKKAELYTERWRRYVSFKNPLNDYISQIWPSAATSDDD